MKPTPRERLDAAAGTRIPANVNLYPRIAAQLERKTFMQTLRAKPVLMILFVLLALVVLSGAAYAIGRSLGYIPGVGIVEQGAPIRVLAEPVSITRDGITVTVTEATLASDKTVLTYTIENVPWDAISHQEDVSGCYGQVNIRLPNGSLLVPQSGSGGMDDRGSWEARMVYGAFSAEFNEAEFLMDCIRETLPGKAPENWKLNLHFVPASPDLTVVPVVEIPTSTPVAPTTTEFTNPPQVENAQEFENIYGIRLVLDKFIPLDDGYTLIGHTEWTDERVQLVATTLKAYDASGQELALDPHYDDDIPLPENGWAFKLYGKAFDGDVRLAAHEAYVEYSQPALITIDLAPFGFTFDDSSFGVPYKTGAIPLDIPGLSAQLSQATYIKLGDLHGFELAFDGDARLLGISLVISDGLDTSGLDGIASGGSSFREPKNGAILSQAMTNARMFFPMTFRAYGATLRGNWSVSWNPPAAPAGATPFYVPQACLGLDSVKQALANPSALPSDLTGKLLLMRGALSPDPTLFISNLDGSAEIPLAFGHGSLSPDGSRVAYSDENNQLTLMEVASKQKTILGAGYLAPRWSPDGAKIAFQRQTAKGFNIFIMDSDGTNLRALTDTTELFSLSGWSGDGQFLFIQTGTRLELLNVNDGNRNLLLETQHNPYGSPSAALSPDGQWLAYLDSVPGRRSPGLFLSRLDGTDKRLLVQLDHWPVLLPAFSPDGQWLAFGTLNVDIANPMQATSILLNIQTCQPISLPGFEGEVRQWLQP